MGEKRRRHSRAPKGGKMPVRHGVPVRARLNVNEWSIACLDDLPNTRLHDQVVVSFGYDTTGGAVPRNVSLRIGNAVVVLDAPAILALRQLLYKAQANRA